MSGFLPNIGRPAEGNVRRPSTAAPQIAVTASVRSSGQTPVNLRRTIQSICSSDADHDGYLKLLQSVRRRFVGSSTYDPTEHLPLIVPPRHRTAASAPRTRFSQGLHAPPPTVSIVESEETTEREYIADAEVWARRVAHEMMIVHYVSFVLRQELEELQHEEREQRAGMRYAEEKERHWILHESDVSKRLDRMRSASRAREEKERRLAEQSRLYPKTPTAAAGAAAAAAAAEATGTAVHMPRPPAPAEEDARAILRRYVRLKHTADVDASLQSLDVSAMSGDLISSTRIVAVPNAMLRKTLGIASYMTLLEKHEEDRRFLMACEQSEFGGIVRLFQEELTVVWAWEHKRMHLERLLRWRGERDERRAESRTVSPNQQKREKQQRPQKGRFLMLLQGGTDPYEDGRHAAQREDMEDLEAEDRDILVRLEEVHRLKIGDTFEVRKPPAAPQPEAIAIDNNNNNDKNKNNDDGAAAVLVPTAGESDHAVDTAAVSADDVTLQWDRNACENIPQVVALQRAVLRWRAGRLGWRRTHKEIGRELQARRDAAKIKRGEEALATFRAELIAECEGVRNEILAIQAARRRELMGNEFQCRVSLTSREEFDFCALVRKTRADFFHNVTEPAIRQCILEEEDQRRETDVQEEFLRDLIHSARRKLLHILAEKRDTCRAEVFARDIIARDEAEDRRDMYDVELDERELLRIAAVELAIEMAEARARAAAEAFAQQSELHHLHAHSIAALQWRCRAGHLAMSAFDPAPRAALWAAFCDGAAGLMAAEAERAFCAVGAAALAAHAAAVAEARGAVLALREAEGRAALAEAEAEAAREIRRGAKRSERELVAKMREEGAAAMRIQRFYRASLAGKVGRTATRRYLRGLYAHKLELRELREIVAVQRAVVRRAEEKLRDAERESRMEQAAAVAAQIDVLVTKTEPRERRDLEMLEDIIFHVMQRNVYSRGNEQAEPDRIAVLWQFESYERVAVMREWRHGFECVFEPKKATFVKDIMAAKIQRNWRRIVRQRRQEVAMLQAMERVACLEEEERAALELMQLTEFACDVVKPMIGPLFLREYLFADATVLLEHLCLNVGFTWGIVEDEWRNRMLLLWRMRRHYVEAAIDPEEEAERARVEQKFYYDGVEQLEMIEEEETIRTALEKERVYFLLRMLIKAERESRNILACGFDEFHVELNERKGRCSVIAAYFTTLCESLVTAAYGRAAAIDAEEVSERRTRITMWEASKPREVLEKLYATEEEEEEEEENVAATWVPLQRLVAEEIKEAEEVEAIKMPDGGEEFRELDEVHEIGEVGEVREVEGSENMKEIGEDQKISDAEVIKDDLGEVLEKNQPPLVEEEVVLPSETPAIASTADVKPDSDDTTWNEMEGGENASTPKHTTSAPETCTHQMPHQLVAEEVCPDTALKSTMDHSNEWSHEIQEPAPAVEAHPCDFPVEEANTKSEIVAPNDFVFRTEEEGSRGTCDPALPQPVEGGDVDCKPMEGVHEALRSSEHVAAALLNSPMAASTSPSLPTSENTTTNNDGDGANFEELQSSRCSLPKADTDAEHNLPPKAELEAEQKEDVDEANDVKVSIDVVDDGAQRDAGYEYCHEDVMEGGASGNESSREKNMEDAGQDLIASSPADGVHLPQSHPYTDQDDSQEKPMEGGADITKENDINDAAEL